MAAPDQELIDDLVAIAETTPALTEPERRAALLSGLPKALELLCKQEGIEQPEVDAAVLEKAVDRTLTLLAQATTGTEKQTMLDVFVTLMGVGLEGRHLTQMVGYVLLAAAKVDSPKNNAELLCKAAAIDCLREHREQQQAAQLSREAIF
jgi:hypothetical protein